jgi:hypothetical protein
LLSHIYAQRSFELWKVPEVSEWLKETISANLLSELSSKKPSLRVQAEEKYSSGTPQNISRHILVIENRQLMSFLSPQALPPSMVSFDPLPPSYSRSAYNEEYFATIGRLPSRSYARGGRAAEVIAQQLAAENNVENPALLQELIMQAIERERQERGGAEIMPGALEPEPQEEEFFEEEEEEEDEDEENDGGEDSEVSLNHESCWAF